MRLMQTKMLSRGIRNCVIAVALLAAAGAQAFSLIGPLTSWQVVGLAYGFGEDIGGPMYRDEGFRWNVPVITYGFDKSFIDYFGPNGVKAIDEAFLYFNDLPRVTQMSTNLEEYSTSTLRENFSAGAMSIIDVKSTAMSLIMEELGFADPIRYTFTLRSRSVVGTPPVTNYATIMRNFDPVTWTESRYVNGKLYSYQIQEFRLPDHADALEFVSLGEDDRQTIPVASGLARITLDGSVSDSGAAGSTAPGLFRIGLTRDDVGGIRWLYRPSNFAMETLLPTITAGFALGARGAWIPFTGLTNDVTVTNGQVIGTNQFVSQGWRGGRNHMRFQRAFFDPIFGQTFVTLTNAYTDVTVTTNRTLVVQALQRAINGPDFLFLSEDLGLVQNLVPALLRRTGTAGWINNDAINGADETALSAGPGVIAPPVQISFSKLLPYFLNFTSAFLDDFPGEGDAAFSGVWGSFDGSTNAPIIYPVGGPLTLQQLRQQILRGER
ncbi:MAG TPA: hypothetical protein VK530_03590 [Candidatus Acidoferrum sp.]|nr:hypothetical protein [Candidatus Acidoferrum sp.]